MERHGPESGALQGTDRHGYGFDGACWSLAVASGLALATALADTL